MEEIKCPYSTDFIISHYVVILVPHLSSIVIDKTDVCENNKRNGKKVKKVFKPILIGALLLSTAFAFSVFASMAKTDAANETENNIIQEVTVGSLGVPSEWQEDMGEKGEGVIKGWNQKQYDELPQLSPEGNIIIDKGGARE